MLGSCALTVVFLFFTFDVLLAWTDTSRCAWHNRAAAVLVDVRRRLNFKLAESVKVDSIGGACCDKADNTLVKHLSFRFFN